MRLTAFFLADHAESVGGKLYVTGGCWNTIYVTELPVQHPHLSLALAIGVPWEETNQRHQLEIELIDADGHPVMPQKLSAGFEAGRPPGMRAGDENPFVLVFNINGLRVEHEGWYEFVCTVDGSRIGEARFKIVRREAGNPPGR